MRVYTSAGGRHPYSADLLLKFYKHAQQSIVCYAHAPVSFADVPGALHSFHTIHPIFLQVPANQMGSVVQTRYRAYGRKEGREPEMPRVAPPGSFPQRVRCHDEEVHADVHHHTDNNLLDLKHPLSLLHSLTQ
jgi:hypothetical protein